MEGMIFSSRVIPCYFPGMGNRPFNGTLYVLTTGCTWYDVPANCGTKSTVHRHHLELYKGVYQAIFLDLLQSGTRFKKLIPRTAQRISRISRRKKGVRSAMMAIK